MYYKNLWLDSHIPIQMLIILTELRNQLKSNGMTIHLNKQGFLKNVKLFIEYNCQSLKECLNQMYKINVIILM